MLGLINNRMNRIFISPQAVGDNINLAIFINLLIYVVFLLTVPTILILCLTFIKPKLKQNQLFNLYAFSSALLLSIGTLGLLFEATDGVTGFVSSALAAYSETNQTLIKIAIIVGGAILGLTLVISFRFLYIHFTKQDHCNHTHDHSLHIMNEGEDVQHKIKEHKPNLKAA